MRKLFAAMALCLACAAPAHAEGAPTPVPPASVQAPAGSAGKASPSRDAVQMALDSKDQFLKKHGLREGLTKGRNLVSAAVLVERAVSHPEYECYRLLALKNAEGMAFAELVRISAESVSTAMEKTFFEEAGGDTGFPSSGKGPSSAVSFKDKVRSVPLAKLETLFKENGGDPAQFAALPDEGKKELAAHALMKAVAQKALKTLAGMSVLASFSAEDEDGQGAVCVVMGASPELESIAEGFRSGQKPSLVSSGAELAEAIPQDTASLYACCGTRVISTAEGPVLVSYGMTTCPYISDDPIARDRKRGVAERMADSLAREQAARFLSQCISSGDAEKLDRAVRATRAMAGDGMSLSTATEKALTHIFTGRIEPRVRELLAGISTVKRWSLVRNGRVIVGVVKVLEMPDGLI